MELFFRYLHQHRRGLLMFALFCVIFCVSFLLYHLPVGAVLYPALLCALLLLGFALYDFRRVRRRHRALVRLAQLPAESMTGFPDADGLEDADYQAVIRHLQEEKAALQTAMNSRYNDMMDYYTVWVHQIKTPIAAMCLTLQNEDTPFSRRLNSDLFRIEQYVEMVLAFLRLDSPATDYVIREQELDGIIRSAVRKFAGEFIGRKLRLDYTPVHLKVITDEKWLCFVLEQLLSNALKYTREGGIRIYLEQPRTLCIADTGVGIAPEDLPRIFENGYTGYNGRADKKASGLGLYLCRSICTRLGHRISASSSTDSGTVVRIDLNQYPLQAE